MITEIVELYEEAEGNVYLNFEDITIPEGTDFDLTDDFDLDNPLNL